MPVWVATRILFDLLHRELGDGFLVARENELEGGGRFPFGMLGRERNDAIEREREL